MVHTHGSPQDQASGEGPPERRTAQGAGRDGPLDGSGCAGVGAWKAFLRAHALVTRRIESDLLTSHGLSLVSFEVLVCLADAPERKLRMAELADLLVVSRSGVTRAVDRLARQGLVTRERCDSDLRGTYAALTAAGLERLIAAAPTHQAGVRFYLLEPLGAGPEAALAGILAPVIHRLESA